MTDSIIIAIVVVVIFIAVRCAVKRSRSKGGCCSGSGYVAKSRKLKAVAETKTFHVEGMHCQNCANRVIEDVQDIPGTSASVNLKKGTVTISAEHSVDDAVIVAAIEKHGYRVI